MSRPPVDVVVPFAGAEAELQALLARLRRLSLGEQDTLVVVDNRPGPTSASPMPEVLRAGERQSSYYARNRGAEHGRAPWLVFIDADVTPAADLLDRYFAEPVDERTAVLAGSIRDVAPAGRPGLGARFARLSRPLSDENVWRPGFAYAQTANAAIRRSAFEAVNGFSEVRSGGDADLCFRLSNAGWRIERRDAVVEHYTRTSLRAIVRQYLRYGAGAQWLEARYPGFVNPRQSTRAIASVARGELAALRALARGDVDDAILHSIYPICNAAFEFGRWLPNRPGPLRAALAEKARMRR